MFKDLHQEGLELMKAQRYSEALSIFWKATEKGPSFWINWKNVGTCYLHMNELDEALTYFKKALTLKPDEPAVLVDIGIVLQLKGNFTKAIDSFRRAIEINPDYELAYNSLALTQKMQGRLDLSLHNYDAGAKALSRNIVKKLQNDRSSKIIKHKDIKHELWLEYAFFGAMYLCSINQEINSIAWPSGHMAEEEERTEQHKGLYWVDQLDADNKLSRLFLPNYFTTFMEILRQDRTYSDLIGNRGTVLDQLGRNEEAKKHFDEANYFLPVYGA